jgi:hypothetical protein
MQVTIREHILKKLNQRHMAWNSPRKAAQHRKSPPNLVGLDSDGHAPTEIDPGSER